MILLLFDVDGTLSHPQRPILEEIRCVLRKLSQSHASEVHTGVVSGSGSDKVTRQTGVSTLADMHRSSKNPKSCLLTFAFYENGLVAYRETQEPPCLSQISCRNFRDHIGMANYVKLVNGILKEFAAIELPAKGSHFIELRTGTLNVSPLGRACTYEERDAFAVYDKETGIRKQLQQTLMRDYGEAMGLNIAIGGQISLDIYPHGWDKSYCLSLVNVSDYSEIHFFGDRCAEGGNDHGLYVDERVTNRHSVTGPEETLGVLKALLKRADEGEEGLTSEERSLINGD